MIDYKSFEGVIKSIKQYYDTNDKLTKVLNMGGTINDKVIEGVIRFIEKAYNDKSEWISYWIYELDFGKKYKKGTVTIGEGKNRKFIPLKTIKDLHKVLINNIKDDLERR